MLVLLKIPKIFFLQRALCCQNDMVVVWRALFSEKMSLKYEMCVNDCMTFMSVHGPFARILLVHCKNTMSLDKNLEIM